MYCKKCGKEIDNDSIFCSSCGTKVPNTQTKKSSTQEINDVSDTSKQEKKPVAKKPVTRKKVSEKQEPDNQASEEPVSESYKTIIFRNIKNNIVNIILVIVVVNVILFIYKNISESNPIKDTVWRSVETVSNDSFYFIKFENKDYEIKENDTLRERGTYKIKYKQNITLKPTQGRGAYNKISILGDNKLIIEGDTITVIDGDKYMEFSRWW